MVVANLPNNEAERLMSLDRYKILDTLGESAYDEIVKLAAHICEAKIGMINFVDGNRVWPKATVGAHAIEIPRDISFCSHAILQDQPLVIPDLSKDFRFQENPLVFAEPCFRFYAAVPLVNARGFALGTLCVLDTVAKELSKTQIEMLRSLAQQVSALLEYRMSIMKVTELSHELFISRSQSMQPIDPKLLASLDEDISIPIGKIIGLSEQLNSDYLSDDQAESLTNIENLARRVQALIARTADIQNNELRLDHVIRDLKASFQREADAKDLVLDVYAPSLRRAVSGDAVRLREVLSALVGNALKFTNEGRVLLDIQVMEESPHSTVVRFNVRDTGCGIPLDTLTQIVVDLSDSNSEVRRHDHGKLGLANAKRLVDRMDGKMGVESTIDVGSTFWFELDLKNVRASVQPAKSSTPTVRVAEPLSLVAPQELQRLQLLAGDSISPSRSALGKFQSGIGPEHFSAPKSSRFK
jgi:two-component system, sensor histidine kinase